MDEKEKTLTPRIITLWGDKKPSDTYEFGENGELTIGRSSENNIVLYVPTVSSKHCRVYTQYGHHYVEDVGSTNGTKLNKNKIESAQIISSGDIIQVGEIELLFESEEEKTKEFHTVIDLEASDMIAPFETNIDNLSPFHHERGSENKYLKVIYWTLGILSIACAFFMFAMAKALLFG